MWEYLGFALGVNTADVSAIKPSLDIDFQTEGFALNLEKAVRPASSGEPLSPAVRGCRKSFLASHSGVVARIHRGRGWRH